MTYSSLDLLRDLRLLAEGLEHISIGLEQAADKLRQIDSRLDDLHVGVITRWRGMGIGEAEREEENA